MTSRPSVPSNEGRSNATGWPVRYTSSMRRCVSRAFDPTYTSRAGLPIGSQADLRSMSGSAQVTMKPGPLNRALAHMAALRDALK